MLLSQNFPAIPIWSYCLLIILIILLIILLDYFLFWIFKKLNHHQNIINKNNDFNLDTGWFKHALRQIIFLIPLLIILLLIFIVVMFTISSF